MEGRRPAAVAFAAVVAAVGAALAGLVLWLGLGPTAEPQYFAHLAWSFLHGRLDLVGIAPTAHDVSPFAGKVYTCWPPLAALLMLPGVAATGPELFPQRWFAVAFGALNAGLCWLVVERFASTLGLRRPRATAVVGAIAFGLGTSNLVFAAVALHWYVAQLTAATALLAGLWFALDRRPERRGRAAFLGGCGLALAAAGRTHLTLAAPLWLYLAVSDERYELPGEGGLVRRAWAALRGAGALRKVALVIAPLAVVALALAAYDLARFGSALETGTTWHNMNSRFRPDFELFGYFHPIFVPRNAYVSLVRPPLPEGWDGWHPTEGFSVLAQSPVLLLALAGRAPEGRRALATAVWCAAALAAVPILLLMNTGWVQFGARYVFDVVPLVWLLVVLKGARLRPGVPLALAAASVAINVYGAHWLAAIR